MVRVLDYNMLFHEWRNLKQVKGECQEDNLFGHIKAILKKWANAPRLDYRYRESSGDILWT